MGVVAGLVIVAAIVVLQTGLGTGSMGMRGVGQPGQPAGEPFTGPRNQCSAPYHVTDAQGRCYWSCGEGTHPDAASNKCICSGSLYEIPLPDAFGRFICRAREIVPAGVPFTGSQNRCTAPYHIIDAQGRCFWSCGEGTRPDAISNKCVCNGGLRQTRQSDDLGRRVCR